MSDWSLYSPPFVQSRATAVAWFQITQIEGSSNDTIESDGSPPTYRIDANSTRMVQTGVVNATVPDALAYFGISAQPYDTLSVADVHSPQLEHQPQAISQQMSRNI